MSTTQLIYGKNPTERIVSIEVEDDSATLFIEEPDGSIKQEIVNNRYWILSNTKLNNRFTRLNGDLHYKYGIQFTEKAEFTKMRYIWRNHDIYSIYNPQEALMVKDGYRYFKGMAPEDVSVLSFDLETNSLKVNEDSKVLIISNTFRKNGVIRKKTFEYKDFDNCGKLIEAWAEWVRHMDPSIIIGHNIYNFDLKFLHDSAKRDGTKISLGRNGSDLELSPRPVTFRVDGSRDMEVNRFSIYGREICDTYYLSLRYDAVPKKYESYGLKYIIKSEGLEKENRNFYDASKIRENYLDPEEWNKIVEYCKDDSDDALALYDLMIPSYFYVNQSVPKSFGDILLSATGGQINSLLVGSYLQDKHSIPKKTDLTGIKVEGGISFAIPGIYQNLYKEDLKSAYPSQVLRFKLYDKEKDPNAHFFKIMDYFAKERFKLKDLYKETKKQYYKDRDGSAKVFLNSGYGVCNTPGLNFNSPDVAKTITEETRKVIDLGLRWASGKGKDYWMQKFFDVVGKDKDASGILEINNPLPLDIPSHGFIIGPTDTDSISFCKEDMSPFSEEEKSFLHNELCSISPAFMEWEQDGGQEGVYEKCIAFKAKNYVLFDGKKVSIKGSALKSSKLEKRIKRFQRDMIDSMLAGRTDYKELYDTVANEILNLKDITEWCSRKTISDKVLESDRENEAKIRRAIEGSAYVEGDKILVFYLPNDELCLVENFNGEYNQNKLFKRLFDSSKVFANVIDTDRYFVNYSLKKNQEKLKELQ